MAIVAILFACFMGFFWTNRADGREPGDDGVIEQLRKAGSNLAKPHPINFYIYVPKKESAEKIAKVLADQNFRVEVKPSPTDSKWLALASKALVPTSDALAKLRRDLTALAQKEGGEYDGWEAAVTK